MADQKAKVEDRAKDLIERIDAEVDTYSKGIELPSLDKGAMKARGKSAKRDKDIAELYERVKALELGLAKVSNMKGVLEMIKGKEDQIAFMDNYIKEMTKYCETLQNYIAEFAPGGKDAFIKFLGERDKALADEVKGAEGTVHAGEKQTPSGIIY